MVTTGLSEYIQIIYIVLPLCPVRFYTTACYQAVPPTTRCDVVKKMCAMLAPSQIINKENVCNACPLADHQKRKMCAMQIQMCCLLAQMLASHGPSLFKIQPITMSEPFFISTVDIPLRIWNWMDGSCTHGWFRCPGRCACLWVFIFFFIMVIQVNTST